MRPFTFALACAVTLLSAPPASVKTIIDDWASIKAPPAPELKSVTVDPRTDALLVLDFNGAESAQSGPCNKTDKPRCLASLPGMHDLIEKARAKGVFIVYSVSPNGAPGDIWKEVAPRPGDPIVKSGPDKYLGTNLGELLSGKGVRRLIVTGTAAEGAVLDTATDAALRGMNIVIPVDGMSSTEPYAEQYVAWHMTHAPGVAAKTTLTRIDKLAF